MGRTKSRKGKHWKGEWDVQMHDLTRVKNWKRRMGLCHKEEKRAIKRRKRQLKRERKRMRRERLLRLRTRDPRKYWRQIQDLMGKPKGDTPTGVYYKGKQLEQEETLQAWADMFLKQNLSPWTKQNRHGLTIS